MLGVLESVTECYRVLQSVTEYYGVLQSVTEYYRVLQSITKYYKDKASASTWTNFLDLQRPLNINLKERLIFSNSEFDISKSLTVTCNAMQKPQDFSNFTPVSDRNYHVLLLMTII